MSIIVSPKVEIQDEQQVIDAVLDGLSRGSEGADGARATWSQAKSFQVRRMEPIWTARGKLMPLHLAKAGSGSQDDGDELRRELDGDGGEAALDRENVREKTS